MAIDPNRAKEIFLAATEQPDETARVAYLDHACAGDDGLRARVEALLRAHDPDGSFLGTPAAVVPDLGHSATMAYAATGELDTNPSSTAEALALLAPPGRPGSLGRIGHYEVLQVLGHGGFGVVFRASDDILQRVVAVKVMAPQIAATSPARRRFLREARSTAQVRHDNVVQVYEVVEQPLPYLVMEFIPGETLQQKLDRVGPLEVREVLRIGRQIAEGLAAAHDHDLIHRDIKPGNILLESGPHGHARITDFGLARAADDASISQSGIVAGTPMYMAPEQAQGQPLDHRADLFSLGSVLYQMVAGRPPFRANTTVAVLKRVAEDRPRAIREIIPETPQWLCDIIAKLHAKDPDDRYQSAREVAGVLADCEAQLKANSKLKDFSRIPRLKSASSGSGKWVALAAVLLLPLIALAVAELAGLTHLFRAPKPDPNRPGGKPTPVPVARQETLPPTFTNSIGMQFVIVPKGKSWLGGGKDKLGDREVEIPADYYLGKYEVTQEEWEKVMGENPSHFTRMGDGMDAVKDITDADLKRFPVEKVSWDQCQIFVAKLNKLEKETGWVYRLPREVEWEYACRGGPMADKLESPFEFYFARPTNILLQKQANFGGDHGLTRTCKVGSYEANCLGLFDLHGNVLEWCLDTVDAADGSWAYRGGGWANANASECQAAIRNPYPAPVRSWNLGLRLARVPSGAPSPAAKSEPPLDVKPFTDADARRIAALPAAEQVEEVRKELMRRNPEFDGFVEPTIEKDAVTGLKFSTLKVTDISPVRALTGLRTLRMGNFTRGKGVLADLSPLQGMALERLSCASTKVSDLSPLKGMKLQELLAMDTEASDLTPLQGMPLKHLDLHGARHVTNLKPLQGMPLEYLNLSYLSVRDLSLLAGMTSLRDLVLQEMPVSDLTQLQGLKLRQLALVNSQVSDLTPLRGMELQTISLTPRNVTKGLDVLRDMKSLKTIGVGYANTKIFPAAEFWERYDKGEFK